MTEEHQEAQKDIIYVLTKLVKVGGGHGDPPTEKIALGTDALTSYEEGVPLPWFTSKEEAQYFIDKRGDNEQWEITPMRRFNSIPMPKSFAVVLGTYPNENFPIPAETIMKSLRDGIFLKYGARIEYGAPHPSMGRERLMTIDDRQICAEVHGLHYIASDDRSQVTVRGTLHPTGPYRDALYELLNEKQILSFGIRAHATFSDGGVVDTLNIRTWDIILPPETE